MVRATKEKMMSEAQQVLYYLKHEYRSVLSDIKSLHVTYYGWHDLPQGLWIINEYFKLIYSIKDKTRIKYNRLYTTYRYEPYQLESI
jgi:hypothetical protein